MELSYPSNNKRMRGTCDVRELLINVDADLVREQAVEWPDSELTTFHDKIQKLHLALAEAKEMRKAKKIKLQNELQNALTNQLSKPNPTIIPWAALEQVSLSGYIPAEELGRFLLFTCKFFSELLTQDFLFQALGNVPSDRLGFVPQSILRKYGPKWVINKFLLRDNMEEERVQEIPWDQPTTLTKKNLTLTLKLYNDSSNSDFYSLTLTEEDLQNAENNGICSWTLSLDDHPGFQRITGDYSVTATLLAFREDTEQVGNIMKRQHLMYDLEGDDCWHTECEGDGDGDLLLVIRFHIDHENREVSLDVQHLTPLVPPLLDADPNYTFFRGLNEGVKWKPEPHLEFLPLQY